MFLTFFDMKYGKKGIVWVLVSMANAQIQFQVVNTHKEMALAEKTAIIKYIRGRNFCFYIFLFSGRLNFVLRFESIKFIAACCFFVLRKSLELDCPYYSVSVLLKIVFDSNYGTTVLLAVAKQINALSSICVYTIQCIGSQKYFRYGQIFIASLLISGSSVIYTLSQSLYFPPKHVCRFYIFSDCVWS